ncbi:hypothetical protein EV182_005271 [Spiromyces aspiralis]|uniref:Uncharacterized protein n=1 Tax=Spiromyces aspiralis TaxID=68401 RepID=A0ACC1HQ34_9FUNG|nr:hypothetical protein EV182_005271 [Spiromyces aspiralis]
MLLLVTPFAIVSYFQDWNGLAIFILNLISLIPLANLMGFVTEEIILRLNHILGALLSCTLGNAVEFITGIMALRQQKYEIIQMTMLGVVMANTMLVVGLAFFVGGCRYRDQYFNLTLAQTCTALMGLGVLSMIVPAAFTQVHAPNREVSWAILSLSRGTAIILLVVYILYIFFQLRTHSDVLKQRHEGAKSVVSWEERRRAKMASDSDDDLVAQQAAAGPEDKPLDGTTPRGCSTPTTIVAVPTENREKVLQQQAGEHSGDNDRRKAHGRNHGQRHTPQLVPWVALIFLSIVSVLVSLTVEILIHNIDHVTENWNLSSEFLGQIVLPATISVSERLMTISLAFKNEMDLTICIITGSSMQITLFVLPLLVIIAWIAGHNLPLQFDAFETTVMLISVLVINYVIVNGRSNWMKGSMLISAYAIVAMAFYFYPLDSDDKGGMSSAGLAILNKDT